ncbi:MAG: hypothetical protein AAF196_13405 [Planctomycetota bacterium]
MGPTTSIRQTRRFWGRQDLEFTGPTTLVVRSHRNNRSSQQAFDLRSLEDGYEPLLDRPSKQALVAAWTLAALLASCVVGFSLSLEGLIDIGRTPNEGPVYFGVFGALFLPALGVSLTHIYRRSASFVIYRGVQADLALLLDSPDPATFQSFQIELNSRIRNAKRLTGTTTEHTRVSRTTTSRCSSSEVVTSLFQSRPFLGWIRCDLTDSRTLTIESRLLGRRHRSERDLRQLRPDPVSTRDKLHRRRFLVALALAIVVLVGELLALGLGSGVTRFEPRAWLVLAPLVLRAAQAAAYHYARSATWHIYRGRDASLELMDASPDPESLRQFQAELERRIRATSGAIDSTSNGVFRAARSHGVARGRDELSRPETFRYRPKLKV